MNHYIIERAKNLKVLDDQLNELVNLKLAAIRAGEWEQVAQIEKATRDLLAEMSVKAATLATMLLEVYA